MLSFLISQIARNRRSVVVSFPDERESGQDTETKYTPLNMLPRGRMSGVPFLPFVLGYGSLFFPIESWKSPYRSEVAWTYPLNPCFLHEDRSLRADQVARVFSDFLSLSFYNWTSKSKRYSILSFVHWLILCHNWNSRLGIEHIHTIPYGQGTLPISKRKLSKSYSED